MPAGLGRADHYPGPESAEAKFLERSEYARRTGTPIYVGEFAPIYTGDEQVDAVRRQILDDQLQLYRRYGAGFATWMYKDLGRPGADVGAARLPVRRARRRLRGQEAPARRRPVGQHRPREPGDHASPLQDLVAREAPDFDPYPWGRFDFVRTLVLNLAFAQSLTHEYAELFRGLGDDELVALADSFAFANCAVRETPARPAERSVTAVQTTFGVLGSGWRSEFFLRLARMAPDRLRAAGVVTRTAERGAEVTAEWGVPTFRTVAELLAAESPDFVIVSTPWPVTPDAVRELVGLGARVLAETPPAPDLPGLRALWADVGASGLVQVAEQYLLMPGHAARLAVVREGVIGAPTSVQVSSTHLYHAVSMIRGLLGVGFEPAVVSARAFTAPLVDPLSFAGWSGDSTPKDASTTLATLDFGGRMGLYDFTDNQWWNPLRARRIVVRGSIGELVDDRLVRLTDPRTAVESHLVPRRTGIDLNLEGSDLDHISFDGRVVYRNPFFGARFSEDDLGVAVLLEQTGAWARGEGPEPYPLADGLQDHLISVAIGESLATGRDVTTTTEAWARRHESRGSARGRGAAADRGPDARGSASRRGAGPHRRGGRLPQRLPLHDRRPALPAPGGRGPRGRRRGRGGRRRRRARRAPATPSRCCGGRAAGAASTASPAARSCASWAACRPRRAGCPTTARRGCAWTGARCTT